MNKKSNKSELEQINKNIKPDDSQTEKLKKEQEIFQKNASSYNGAIRENYSWTQNINDIDIQVKVNIYSSLSIVIQIFNLKNIKINKNQSNTNYNYICTIDWFKNI